METAQPAIDKAIELAQVAGGSLRLIYVRAIVPVTYMEFMPPTFDEEQQAEAEKKLKEAQAAYEAIVRTGDAPKPVGSPQAQGKPNGPNEPPKR